MQTIGTAGRPQLGREEMGSARLTDLLVVGGGKVGFRSDHNLPQRLQCIKTANTAA